MNHPIKPLIQKTSKAMALFRGNIVKEIVEEHKLKRANGVGGYAHLPYSEKEMKKILRLICKGASLEGKDIWDNSWVSCLFESYYGQVTIPQSSSSNLIIPSLSYCLKQIDPAQYSELTTHLFLNLSYKNTSDFRELIKQLLICKANPLPQLILKIKTLKNLEQILESKKDKNHFLKQNFYKKMHQNYLQLADTKDLLKELFSVVAHQPSLHASFLNHLSQMQTSELDFIQHYYGLWKPFLSQFPEFVSQIETVIYRQNLHETIPTVSPENQTTTSSHSTKMRL